MRDNETKRRSFLKSIASAGAMTGLLEQPALAHSSIAGAEAPICKTCGTQFPPSQLMPQSCPICEDERQYVGLQGQRWTTLAAMRGRYKNVFTEWEPGLHSIQTSPKFGIGQRAFLIQTPEGNLLWDCVSLIDEPTLERVRDLGGIDAIAVSHPHYYSAVIEWSHAFDRAPVYLHQNDAEWVMREDGVIHFWRGESLELFGELLLVNTGGHFDGFQVLHKPGTLFAGDQPQVCMDRQWVSFMYSYPNYIPLSKQQIQHIVNQLEPLDYNKLYGAFPHQNIQTNAKEIVARSAERYIQAISTKTEINA